MQIEIPPTPLHPLCLRSHYSKAGIRQDGITQRWYLGRNKPRSWSIPTTVSDSPGLWEGIWENRKLKSKHLRLMSGAHAQQRFDTRLCPRQSHHCPDPPIRGSPRSELYHRDRASLQWPRGGTAPSDAHPCVTALHPCPSFQHSRAAPCNTRSIKIDTVCTLALPWGRGVLSRLLRGAEAPPAALCSLGPLPKPTPCPASK